MRWTIAWDNGGNGGASSDTIAEFVRGGLSAPEAGVGRKHGDVAQALAGAARRIEAEYAVPFSPRHHGAAKLHRAL